MHRAGSRAEFLSLIAAEWPLTVCAAAIFVHRPVQTLMFARREALQVRDIVVFGIAIEMMDMAARRDRAVVRFPGKASDSHEAMSFVRMHGRSL
jgi:hypothetical protein